VGITRAKNHLFLSLHHEGFRGGITQFNKISRFVDVPNVLSKLSLEGVKQEKREGYGEVEEVLSPYNKESLFQRVMDFLERKGDSHS
jgi:hypothetical protein